MFVFADSFFFFVGFEKISRIFRFAAGTSVRVEVMLTLFVRFICLFVALFHLDDCHCGWQSQRATHIYGS